MDESVDLGTRQYVLFSLCGEEYGLPIASVQGILRYEEPTPVPHAPPGVEGVFNLRGQVLPLVDLGRRLRSERITPTPSSRIIVAEAGMGPVGLAVDCVREVATLAEADISPAPAGAVAGDMSEAFEGVATHRGQLIILLDPVKALPKPAFASVIATSEGDADA